MTTQHPVKSPKKLIEVALPLDAINIASAGEKAIRRGHPSTLHLWWARRPLVAARAVIFSQMVNDPSWKWELEHPGEIPPNNLKATWAKSRKRLFSILEELVKWEHTTDETILEPARAEIRKSWRETCELNQDHPQATELFNTDKPPAFHDPFAGGGALPLEAQRLGLKAYASDLNPVAVLINKAMIEIPPTVSGCAPVNPVARAKRDLIERRWSGAQGLADDVRYYGQWMRDEAQKRIGHLYPPVEITADMAKERTDLKPLVGEKLTVIAWLWARTVRSPNPAFRHVEVPLVSSFVLSTKKGKEAYVHPVTGTDGYRFTVKAAGPIDAEARAGTKLARGSNFRCLISGAPISGDYIMGEGKAKRIGSRLMAIVAQGPRGRVYLGPIAEHESVAHEAKPNWQPDVEFFQAALGFRVGNYGMTRWSDLFTARQLVMMTTFCDLVHEARQRIHDDAFSAGLIDDGVPLRDGGTGALAYAEAVAVYLALGVSKTANRANSLATWMPDVQCPGHLFRRHAISMSWDYSEGNSLSGPSGSFESMLDDTADALRFLVDGGLHGISTQANASEQTISTNKVVSTDPPYYDNVGYADLSDFFYVWLRPSLRSTFPDLFATLAVPKADELVATPARHGGKVEAERFFLDGMTQAVHRLAQQAHPAVPVSLYYAFKQSESEQDASTSSTGWETFLEAVIRAGLVISGTWPMRTEREGRTRNQSSNALASSIVLTCRRRAGDAGTVSRRAFQRELNQVLPDALDEMTRGGGGDQSPVAPVDLSQAIIGPGMAVFSKYSAVLEADGTPMSVKTALQLINRFLAEDDFDHDTQFCLHWFEQYGWNDGKFGDADTLARAKGTSVDGVKHAGVISASGGVVRLIKWSDYPTDWDPATDSRLPIWEALHQLIRVFDTHGETGAGAVLANIQDKAEAIRQLGYRLHTLSERAGRAEDARAYNEIITSWSAIESAAAATPAPKQATLFG